MTYDNTTSDNARNKNLNCGSTNYSNISCGKCDKFFYYLNYIVFWLLILTGLFFAISGKIIEPVVIILVCYIIWPVDNTYDCKISGHNIILWKLFSSKTSFPVKKSKLKLYYKNPDFPYLLKGVIIADKQYMIASSKLCWNWCVNRFIKDFLRAHGSVEIYLENKKINMPRAHMLKGESGILSFLLKLK